ncbi:MAG TPA: hypothetical protein VHH11_17325 [Gammaproteobacteria bacterium]|nr:hypothetical protein [Gammaproteobacteria bacterium]
MKSFAMIWGTDRSFGEIGHSFDAGSIRDGSVITLTEGDKVDAHDYGAPTLRRIAGRWPGHYANARHARDARAAHCAE